MKIWTDERIKELIVKPLMSGESEKSIASRLGYKQARISQLKKMGHCVLPVKHIPEPPTLDYCQEWVDWARDMQTQGFSLSDISEVSYIDKTTVRMRLIDWGVRKNQRRQA